MLGKGMAPPLVALVAVCAVIAGILTSGSQAQRDAGDGPEPVVVAAVDEASSGTGYEPDAEPDYEGEGEDETELETPEVETVEIAPVAAAARAHLPGGGRKVFGRKRFLVAYYGTAGTGVLGVLGEQRPDVMHRRLVRAAEPFARAGEQVLPVYELIVTVADPFPGRDGDYNHDITRAQVQTYIDAAERNGALVVLDVQPGRADFLDVAKRWRWALEHPHVGLALDPEWRMRRDQVPGRVIGSVSAAEVNRVSQWLNRFTKRRNLPEKVFMLHSFRSSMIRNPHRIADRAHLAEVLHVDGFGTPSQKLATYRALARPGQFVMGFKLFYDEDVPVMRPREVRRVRPAVRFVSYQ